MAHHEAHVVAQAGTKNWINQITPSLIYVSDGVPLSHGAMPQTGQLRKDEPHPVGSLTSVSQLLNDLAVDLRLSIHEISEIGFSQRGCSKFVAPSCPD